MERGIIIQRRLCLRMKKKLVAVALMQETFLIVSYSYVVYVFLPIHHNPTGTIKNN